MRQIFRNSLEFIGEASGLRPKNWEQAQLEHRAEIKASLAIAIGLISVTSAQANDYEAVRLEQKLFLYHFAGDGVPGDSQAPLQLAAQELLDELYAQTDV